MCTDPAQRNESFFCRLAGNIVSRLRDKFVIIRSFGGLYRESLRREWNHEPKDEIDLNGTCRPFNPFVRERKCRASLSEYSVEL